MPLMHLALGNELCLPLARRKVKDPEGRLKGFGEFSFFDLGGPGVDDAIVQRGLDCFDARSFPRDLAFLPTTTTWLEFKMEGERAPKERQAVILQQPNEGVILVWPVAYGGGWFYVFPELLMGFPGYIGPGFPEIGADDKTALRMRVHRDNPLMEQDSERADAYRQIIPHLAKRTFGALIFINTPRPGGRVQHSPRVGLQRKLAKAKGMTGLYPLQGRQEIRIPLHAPEPVGGQAVLETRVSGEMPWHRVRAHLWCGRQIEEYWRGNPAIGLKRNHYKVAA